MLVLNGNLQSGFLGLRWRDTRTLGILGNFVILGVWWGVSVLVFVMEVYLEIKYVIILWEWSGFVVCYLWGRWNLRVGVLTRGGVW